MSNKIIISRIDGIGVARKIVTSGKTKGIVDRFTNALTNYCSDISDNTVTYMRKKVWDDDISDFLFPPYVECEYVE